MIIYIVAHKKQQRLTQCCINLCQVGVRRLELPTSTSRTWRASQLCYTPKAAAVRRLFCPLAALATAKLTLFFIIGNISVIFLKMCRFLRICKHKKSPTALGHRTFFTSILPCYRLKIILLRQKRQEKLQG